MITVKLNPWTHSQIRDNIALGNPSKANDEGLIREAARLGGAEAVIRKLPEGLDTYLKQALSQMYDGPKEGNLTPSGKPFDVCAVQHAAGIKRSFGFELSGGEMQRLAV